MAWFFFALVGPVLWPVTNYIDKILIGKYFPRGNVGALMAVTGLANIAVVIGIALFDLQQLWVAPMHIAVLIGSGLLLMLCWLAYVYALETDDTSVVVTLYQTMPVFLAILGFIFLHELLNKNQIIGGLLILLGAVGLTLDFSHRIPRLKSKTFFLMMFSSLGAALAFFLFKFMAITDDFWVSTFWQNIGIALAGGLLLLVPSYRRELRVVFKGSPAALIVGNLVSDTCNIVASLAINFAVLMAPLAVVSLIGSLQPFFLFGYGMVLTRYFPQFIQEKISKPLLLQKIISMIIIFGGSYFLLRYTK